jgi:hypothetical protein
MEGCALQIDEGNVDLRSDRYASQQGEQAFSGVKQEEATGRGLLCGIQT